MAVSIIYTSNIQYPAGATVPAFTSGATAPTAAQVQAAQPPALYGTIFWADADTAAVFTTNWGAAGMLAAAAAQYQQVILTKILGGGSDSSFATNFTYGLTNTNNIVITKVGNGAGQGGTYAVAVRLPWSASL